MRFVRRTAE